jgi:hypothetical protein
MHCIKLKTTAMKKNIYLHVPDPCHENWQYMTPVEQGRFCGSCCKQVTDFTQMSDKEILAVLSKAAGNACGRFSQDQLHRPMINEIPPSLRPHKFFLSAFIPAFLLLHSTNAQTRLQGKVKLSTEQRNCDNIVKGEMVRIDSTMGGKKFLEVKGKVSDEYGNPLSGTSVIVKGTNNGVAASEDGSFSINHNKQTGKLVLQFSHVGYNTKEFTVNGDQFINIKLLQNMQILMGLVARNDYIEQFVVKGKVVNERGEMLPYATVLVDGTNNAVSADSLARFKIDMSGKIKKLSITASVVGYQPVRTVIDLKKDDVENLVLRLTEQRLLGEVMVVSYPTVKKSSNLVGGITSVTPVTIIDTTMRFIAKIFKNEMFRIYSNPITKDKTLHIAFGKPGSYVLTVFDNAGRLYLAKDIQVAEKNQHIPLDLPNTLATGAYYLKAINTKTRQHFINKLVVH